MKKKSKIREIKCSHYKGDGYDFHLDENEVLSLCDWCFAQLAPEVVKQVFLEHCIETARVRRNVRDD